MLTNLLATRRHHVLEATLSVTAAGAAGCSFLCHRLSLSPFFRFPCGLCACSLWKHPRGQALTEVPLSFWDAWPVTRAAGAATSLLQFCEPLLHCFLLRQSSKRHGRRLRVWLHVQLQDRRVRLLAEAPALRAVNWLCDCSRQQRLQVRSVQL